MLTTILQFLYELTQWQYFWFLFILWAIVDLVWFGRWQKLIARISKLITKPVIFEKDSEPNDPPLYPRKFMESLAQRKNREDVEPANLNTLNEWVDAQRNSVFDSKNPLRSLGYVITFVGFVFFALADLIVIANTMVLLGLMSPPLPDLLQRLDYAILGGSFLSAIVGVWMLIEMSGKGELISTEQLNSAQKKIYKFIAGIVILIAVLVMLALAFERLIALGYLESSRTTDLMSSFILYGLLAINNSGAAALTISPAASGLVVVLFILAFVFVIILPVLMFFLDVIWRFIYVIVDILVWFFATPIVAIPYGLLKMFGWI